MAIRRRDSRHSIPDAGRDAVLRRLCTVPAAIVFLAGAVGLVPWCGCGPRRVICDVSGTVSLRSGPLAEGNVNLRSPQTGQTATASVVSGTFTFPRTLLPGDYTICVVPKTPSSPLDRSTPSPRSDIPKKFQDYGTSGLATGIREGKNTLDLELD